MARVVLLSTLINTVLSQSSVCIWGKLDWNSRINGLYAHAGSYGSKPYYLMSDGCFEFYLFWHATNSQWRIHTSLNQNSSHAYCTSSTLSDCNAWYVYTEADTFELYPSTQLFVDACPSWECDKVEINNLGNGCDTLFDVHLGDNLWTNSQSTRYWYFYPSASFKWKCNEWDPTTSDDPCGNEKVGKLFAGWDNNYISGGQSLSMAIDPSGHATIRCIMDPTPSPTTYPARLPTKAPTWNPSNPPTLNPSNPSLPPTNNPSNMPTFNPSNHPTNTPSYIPTNNPSNPSSNPTSNPTDNPSNHPTNNPSNYPSNHPTNDPTNHPTNYPTSNPSHHSHAPTLNPSIPLNPSDAPTLGPTAKPTVRPIVLLISATVAIYTDYDIDVSVKQKTEYDEDDDKDNDDTLVYVLSLVFVVVVCVVCSVCLRRNQYRTSHNETQNNLDDIGNENSAKESKHIGGGVPKSHDQNVVKLTCMQGQMSATQRNINVLHDQKQCEDCGKSTALLVELDEHFYCRDCRSCYDDDADVLYTEQPVTKSGNSNDTPFQNETDRMEENKAAEGVSAEVELQSATCGVVQLPPPAYVTSRCEL
eukprot:396487_1